MEDRWVAHHDETASANLISKTNSWYLGSNVEGKPRRVLSYTGGVGTYRQEMRRGGRERLPGIRDAIDVAPAGGASETLPHGLSARAAGPLGQPIVTIDRLETRGVHIREETR